jgi:hypothetical protein
VASIDECPAELQTVIREFWPSSQWDNAASISQLESGWNAFALLDTRTPAHPCGSIFTNRDGVNVSAELSVGYFQINACNFPDWEWQRFYNAHHNAGTAHMLWEARGWQPWYFSAKTLGLI